MIPIQKPQKTEDALDELALAIYGKTRKASILANTCLACDNPATEFRSELQEREFSISGFCQNCQDEVFAPPEDDEDDY
jgi:hypothetical protein